MILATSGFSFGTVNDQRACLNNLAIARTHAMTESANLTILTPPSFITDAAGGVWGLVPSLSKGFQVCHNSSVQTSTANVSLLLYFNHVVYQQNTSGKWYVYQSGSWVATTDPRLPKTTESAEGTTVTTVGPIIYASQTTGTADPNGPWNQWALNSSAQITLNGAVQTVTANVVALVYHNHTLYQHANWGTGDGWWYWQTASSAWTAFSISAVALSSATYTSGAPAGTTIGTISVTTSDGSAFAGTLTVSDTTNFKIVGNTLVTNVALTQATYNITITATPAVVGDAFASAALTITQQGGTTTNGRQYLIGTFNNGNADNPAYHTWMGFYPDYTINNTYMGPDGSGSLISVNNGYPMVIAMNHFNTQVTGFTDPVAAANGSYNSGYDTAIATHIAPWAANIYAVRIDWEWPGTWNNYSPYGYNGGTKASPSITPAVWVAGWRNLAAAFKRNPATAHIKIAWDYPNDASELNSLSYYPGDDVVDIISLDPYADKNWDGATSQICWTNYVTGWGAGHGLTDMAAFAAAHNKPMAFWEWADNYGDGYFITQFAAWMNNHNVVAHSYWDTNSLFAGALQSSPANQAAYIKAFANTTYTGTFWPTIFPLPATKPAGY